MTEKKENTGKLIVSIESVKLDHDFVEKEKAIREAKKSFLIIGDNLIWINEFKLYKQRNFPTFETYVGTMFDFTRDYAYKIMNATRVYNLLKGHFKPSELPKAETHCRPLCKIEKDEDVLAIWENVVTTNKIIAKTVIEMVNQHLGKGKVTPEPETVTETGTDTASGSVESGVEGDELTAVQELKIARARITELENDLEKARSVTGGIAKTKMAREMIQKGFAVLAGTCTDDQKTELIATKKALLG